MPQPHVTTSTTYFDSASSDNFIAQNIPTRKDSASYRDTSITNTSSVTAPATNPQPPKSVIDDILPDVISALAISFITWFATRFWERLQVQKKVNAAPKIYVREIDLLIKRAMREGPANAIVNARAIITARNNMRDSLVTISRQLNSEIDRLANEIGIAEKNFSNRPRENRVSTQVAFDTIKVLSRVWPSKKKQIVVEMRKVLTEMGFNPSAITDSDDDSDSTYENEQPTPAPTPIAPIPVPVPENVRS